ncbi:Fic family protein [Xanthomonas melonis]|nr:Fic family protein [Xanthomonas melonis]
MEFVCLPEIFRPSRASISAFKASKASVLEVPGLDDVSHAFNFVASSVVNRAPASLLMFKAEGGSANLFEKLILEVGKLSIKEILSAHCLMTGAVRSRFRRAPVVVGMAINQPMSFMAAEYDVKSDIEWLISACDNIESDLSMFAFFLFFFLHVHPFTDGNGRISRIGLLGLSRKRGVKAERMAVLVLAYIERYKVEFIRVMYMARTSYPGCLISFVEQALVTRFHSDVTSALAPHDQGN